MTYRVLLVCLGNICRSPTAEAAVREALQAEGIGPDQVEVDSAGTGDWHLGEPPDPRSTAAGRRAGLELTGRARLVTPADLERFDLVLAMDRQNLADLRAMAPDAAARDRIALFRDFDGVATGRDVPDPYAGGPDGFAEVVRIARAGALGVVAHVAQQLGPR